MSNYRSYQKSLIPILEQQTTSSDWILFRKGEGPTGVYSIEFTRLGTPSARVDFFTFFLCLRQYLLLRDLEILF